MEALIECAVECCVDVTQAAIEEAIEAETERRLKKGPVQGENNSPAALWFQRQYPGAEIFFPAHEDMSNKYGQNLDVWYIKLQNEIHRVTVNRTPIGLEPNFIFIDGILVCSKKGGIRLFIFASTKFGINFLQRFLWGRWSTSAN
jgi:hypothetical protein